MLAISKVFSAVLVLGASLQAEAQDAADARVAALAREVADKGWIVYGARAADGAWDLFVSRPDGSGRRNITNTADFEEAAPRFSGDGTKLLYRRFAKGTIIDHDKWGFQGCLVIADADGEQPVVYGADREFPWACWSPDGKQLACLSKGGIEVVDLATREVVNTLQRKGMYQQLSWSPDGLWFCGVANHQGRSWTVVRMCAQTGAVNAVREYQNCTPDWFPDSKRIILSSRPAGQSGDDGYGYTQLWMVDGDGGNQQLVYGEDGCHIYGGALSPDGQYVLFTRGVVDGSGAEQDGAPVCIMRLGDAPSIGGASKDLRTVHRETKDGPVLVLEMGWEPHWTYADIGGE